MASKLINNGLKYAAGRSDDFTVAEPLNGLAWPVDWLDIFQNTCEPITRPKELKTKIKSLIILIRL